MQETRFCIYTKTKSKADYNSSNIRPKRFILKMNLVLSSAFFSSMKRKLGKEKSPAGEKLPEILRNGCKNHNSSRAPISSGLARQTSDFCFRHFSEFLNGNFSHAGLFLNEKIKFYPEPIYAYNKLFIFILDSTAFNQSLFSFPNSDFPLIKMNRKTGMSVLL